VDQDSLSKFLLAAGSLRYFKLYSSISFVAVLDTGSEILGFFGPGIRIWDGKKSESGMNIPDHISESLETILGLRILKFFDADPYPRSAIFVTLAGIRDLFDPCSGIRDLFDPGSGMEKFGSGIQDKHS
jgi:hypothetical protein